MDITLALGGGGVRGISHLGVIQFLQERGFRIRAIAGTSAGSVFGAFICAGHKPADVAGYLAKIDQRRFISRSQNDEPSLIGIAGLRNILVDLLGQIDFKDLSIPMATTSVDLITGREVITTKGNVVEAVLASAAIPGAFPPVQKEKLILIDGGILDPVPVTIARWMKPGLPVFASVLSQFPPECLKKQPEFPFPLPGPTFVKEYFSHFKITQALNIFLRAVDIESTSLTDLRLMNDHPFSIIRTPSMGVGVLDVIDIEKTMQAGYHAAEKVLADIDSPLQRINLLAQKFQKHSEDALLLSECIFPKS